MLLHVGLSDGRLDHRLQRTVGSQHKLQFGSLCVHKPSRFQKGQGQPLHFRRSAARQQGHDGGLSRQTQGLTRLQAVRLKCNHIGHWVADEGALNPMLGQQVRLKRVNAQHMVHAVTNFLHTLWSPGPNGGTHQLDRGNTLLPQQALHGQVEVGRIDAHIQVRGRGQQILNQGLPDAIDVAVTPKRFHQTAYRQLVTGPARHKSGRIHLRPANARSLQERPGFSHALQQ